MITGVYRARMTFEEWLDLNEDELNIYFAETGMDRELDFNIENELERYYQQYLESNCCPKGKEGVRGVKGIKDN